MDDECLHINLQAMPESTENVQNRLKTLSGRFDGIDVLYSSIRVGINL